MNRIDQLFKNHPQNNLSVYFCAGYPKLEGVVETLQALQQGGINMVEIGVPFSDPMADGPVIQSAATQALKNGMTLKQLFTQLQDVRKSVSIPLILMGYLNVFYQYGFENFCKNCQACGIDGAIIPDLPFDVYMKDYKPIAQRYGLHIIMLITPETSEERIRQIDQHTDGFIYQVSTNATTGAQASYNDETLSYFRRISNMKLRNPTMVGFGVSNKATLEAAQTYAAGAIIGSKFIKLQEKNDDPSRALDELKQALAE
ncbi:MAG: tryptophan synthase subunit alpha [Bacteroidaceae bacterium]|nr:tryptophan synthase subunit alpha [Bacteroidaceae bacterium]